MFPKFILVGPNNGPQNGQLSPLASNREHRNTGPNCGTTPRLPKLPVPQTYPWKQTAEYEQRIFHPTSVRPLSLILLDIPLVFFLSRRVLLNLGPAGLLTNSPLFWFICRWIFRAFPNVSIPTSFLISECSRSRLPPCHRASRKPWGSFLGWGTFSPLSIGS